MTDAVLLRVERASKIYQNGGRATTVLDDVSLDLRAGRLTGIMGPSGSGKTTLLMIAGLLEPPTIGAVRFGGEIVSHAEARLDDLRDFRRRHIGFVFQKANLIPFLNATENVAIAMEINDVPAAQAADRARGLLHRLGLGERLTSLPNQLSGGEQQRVSIARALANNPDLILADEPTAALDGGRAEQVVSLFRELAKERQVAVCVVTHDTRWVRLFDDVLYLEDGHRNDPRSARWTDA